MKYEYVDDITSDVKFRAYGKDLREVFENAALAISNIFCDSEKVGNSKQTIIEAKGNNAEELIVNWLNQIIATVDIEEMFFHNFEIESINDNHVKGIAIGDDVRPELGGTVAKAVTNYNFKFEKIKNGYMVQVVVDI